MHQCVYDFKINELQSILEAIKQNKSGSKQTLRKRVLTLLTGNHSKTKALRLKIIDVYKNKVLGRPPKPSMKDFMMAQSFQDYSNFINQRFSHPNSDNSYLPNYVERNITEPQLLPPPPPPPPMADPDSYFKPLSFFKTKQTLLSAIYCQNNVNIASISGLFFLTDNVRHSIMKSWSIPKQEYKLQIVLRMVQIGLQENQTERLPYNMIVSVNENQCKLPTLNIPTKAGITPWRCNVPIDITQQTDLRNCLQNTLKIIWSEEPHEYLASVFVAEKLSWSELLVELRKKPLRTSDKTKELIIKLMQNDADMGVDSLFATIKDPLTKTRMELPARGVDCVHLQCFDAITFLKMNEQKQTWACPLCKKKVKFESIEIDEFFLNILQCKKLSKDCENVILLQDGSWLEKESSDYIKASKLKSNDNKSNNKIEIFTLSDSDDEDIPPPKRSKYSQPNLEKSVIKSEHIDITVTEDLTEIDTKPCTENDLVLDLSLKNSLPPSTNIEQESVIILNDDQEIVPTPSLSNDINCPPYPIAQKNDKNLKPTDSKSNTNSKYKAKDKSRDVLCVITLD